MPAGADEGYEKAADFCITAWDRVMMTTKLARYSSLP